MVVSGDRSEAIVTAVRLSAQPNSRRQRLRLAGLEPARVYRVEELDAAMTGQELMRFGLPLAFEPGDYQSVRFTLSSQK